MIKSQDSQGRPSPQHVIQSAPPRSHSSRFKLSTSYRFLQSRRAHVPFLSFSCSTMTMKRQINLLRGWPNPALLPAAPIQSAAHAALSQPAISTPGLLYGPDPGYQPLRESISRWLAQFYSIPAQDGETEVQAAERICITGGASQNLACILQVFTDPLYTQAWMVAPCFFLACRIFDDSGLKTRAVGEGEEGVDLRALEEGMKAYERDKDAAQVCLHSFI